MTDTLIGDALLSASRIEHPWDQAALDWPLTIESVVVELGGYRARWALQIARRHWPRLYVYEPQPWAYAVCARLLKPYDAFVLPYGVGVRNERLPMAKYETDGCTFAGGGDGPLGELRDAREVLPKHVDLMLVNIEGYEYTLLPYLLDQQLLPDRLMVQWHTWADAGGEHSAIVARLERTHARLWDYGDTLQAWGRR